MSRASTAHLRYLLLGLALVAVLAGTPARQAEAAADLARTMAELGGDERVEEEDGGVGDDTLEAPKADAAQVPAVLPAWDAGPALGSAFLDPRPGLARWSDAPGLFRRPAPPGRMFAWLQRFLF